jgi:hypothetical protein
MEPLSLTTLILSIFSLVLHIKHFKSDCFNTEVIHIDLETTENKN